MPQRRPAALRALWLCSAFTVTSPRWCRHERRGLPKAALAMRSQVAQIFLVRGDSGSALGCRSYARSDLWAEGVDLTLDAWTRIAREGLQVSAALVLVGGAALESDAAPDTLGNSQPAKASCTAWNLAVACCVV